MMLSSSLMDISIGAISSHRQYYVDLFTLLAQHFRASSSTTTRPCPRVMSPLRTPLSLRLTHHFRASSYTTTTRPRPRVVELRLQDLGEPRRDPPPLAHVVVLRPELLPRLRARSYRPDHRVPRRVLPPDPLRHVHPVPEQSHHVRAKRVGDDVAQPLAKNPVPSHRRVRIPGRSPHAHLQVVVAARAHERQRRAPTHGPSESLVRRRVARVQRQHHVHRRRLRSAPSSSDCLMRRPGQAVPSASAMVPSTTRPSTELGDARVRLPRRRRRRRELQGFILDGLVDADSAVPSRRRGRRTRRRWCAFPHPGPPGASAALGGLEVPPARLVERELGHLRTCPCGWANGAPVGSAAGREREGRTDPTGAAWPCRAPRPTASRSRGARVRQLLPRHRGLADGHAGHLLLSNAPIKEPAASASSASSAEALSPPRAGRGGPPGGGAGSGWGDAWRSYLTTVDPAGATGYLEPAPAGSAPLPDRADEAVRVHIARSAVRLGLPRQRRASRGRRRAQAAAAVGRAGADETRGPRTRADRAN